MADITQVFKSTVKMVKLRQKTLSNIKAERGDDFDTHNSALSTSQSSPASSSKTVVNGHKNGHPSENFTLESKEIVSNITGLKNFLLKNRKAYLAASSNVPLENGCTRLTEEERDKIDSDAMKYMKLCKETLSKFKEKYLQKHLPVQLKEHRVLVFNMVEEYLKVVCEIYSEQKAIRVKRAVDRQRLGQLDLKGSLASSGQNRPANQSEETTAKSSQHNQAAQHGSTEGGKSKTLHVFDDSSTSDPVEFHVSTEEAQMYKEENEQLYNELNSTIDEVRQIEGTVIEISKLQEIFTDKVLEQDADLNKISDEVMHSTENVIEGNEDIREAMKNNAGMRVWVIFGICVLSFTLLFLDWYND